MAAGDLTKIKLSGSTDGMNILIVATATLGTTIHTAHATDLDEIYLNACIPGATSREVTIEWGEATSTKVTKVTIPAAAGWFPVVEGKLLTNSLVVTVFCAAAANEVVFDGYVLRHGQ
ncbi:MAG: hypothetical protein A3J29_06205 [Acidobacteria bacterium RIFCSPLOWO2_12_FULL_67_14b]|nr:MAG: hypothetical protein A3J29_06205 [Acidobacteria bacterium RIFCSPLOWO2_12_FULL_67_14b]